MQDMGAGTDALVGFMVDVHRASIDQGHMIRCWVIEANRADFLSMRAYRRFKDVYPHVEVIAPHTQKNKTDEFVGIEAVLKPRYRAGQKRLPWKGLEARNALQRFIKELTRYPNIKQDDLVLSDWFGESHLDQIIAAGAEPSPIVHTSKLAPYLEKQRRIMPLDRSGREDVPEGYDPLPSTILPDSASRISRVLAGVDDDV